MTYEAGEHTSQAGWGNSHSSHPGQESNPGEWRERVQEYAEDYAGTLSHFVARHPVMALAAGFGAGVGLGVLAVAVLRSQEEESWWERHLPSASLHGLTEGIRKLPAKAAEYIPESRSWR
jgi:hypothetical protein